MPIRADASEEKVYTSCLLDRSFVGSTFGFEVWSITVEDVDVLPLDVDMIEEVLPHEGMVALGVIFGDADILVHVERDDMLEGHTPGLIGCHQSSIHAHRRRTRRQTEDERLLSSRLGRLDLADDVVRCPLRDTRVVGLDDKTHTISWFS